MTMRQGGCTGRGEGAQGWVGWRGANDGLCAESGVDKRAQPLGVSICETWRLCFLPYLAHDSPTGSGSARLRIGTLVAL